MVSVDSQKNGALSEYVSGRKYKIVEANPGVKGISLNILSCKLWWGAFMSETLKLADEQKTLGRDRTWSGEKGLSFLKFEIYLHRSSQYSFSMFQPQKPETMVVGLEAEFWSRSNLKVNLTHVDIRVHVFLGWTSLTDGIP